VEHGKLNLEEPISNYLDNLPGDKQQITIKQLLAHTSGIPQYKDDKEIENTIHYNSLQEAMEMFIDRPLLFEPGTKYFYTSYGYVVLGRLIEAVTGMSYEDYMKTFIFDKAGMPHTQVETVNETFENSSCLYHNNGRKAKSAKQNDLSNRVPAGGYLSTLEDVIAFGNAIMKNELISEESLSRMLEIQDVEYDGNKYGLGWFLYGPKDYESLVIGHSGGQSGCTSQLMIIPRSKTVVVVLSNTSGYYPEIATFASNLIGYSERTK